MIKLKYLLTESPDALNYKGKRYRYTTNYSKVSFLIYEDEKTGNWNYFGYSTIINKFISGIPEVLKEIEEKSNVDPDFKFSVAYVTDVGDGSGGHGALIKILRLLKRFVSKVLSDPSSSEKEIAVRIFQVPDKGKPQAIMSFWDNKKDVIKFKSMYDEICRINNLDPSTTLYEDGWTDKIMSYSDFYDVNTNFIKIETQIDKEITKKRSLFVTLNQNRHTQAATMTDGQKAQLDRELHLLDAELRLLHSAKKQGKTKLEDVTFQKAILNAISTKPRTFKDLRNELEAELESSFGMSMSQINQMLLDKGISLKDMIKSVVKEYVDCIKESKLVKSSINENIGLPYTIKSSGDGDFYIQMDGNNAGKPFKDKPEKGNYYAINVDKSKLVPQYFYYIVEYLYSSGKFNQYIKGSVIPHLNIKGFNDVIISHFMSK